MLEHYLTHAQVRELTAMIVPVWFAPDVPPGGIRAMLGATLADAESCVPPERLAVVVDGAETAARVAAEVRDAFAARAGEPFRLVVLEENQGKGAAILAGLDALPETPFTVVRDADGDHFVDDVPHLVRLAHQMVAECESGAVMVIGRRSGVHQPLGWVRGEYELLLNEVVLDALRYALAQRGDVPALHYCQPQLPPDFQSGFKVYSAEAARLVRDGLRAAAARHPEMEMLRWGMELVPLVEIALAGGVFGEVHRIAYHDQPVTAYGNINRPRAYGKKTAWVLGRCGVPPAAARRMLDNALAHRLLDTDPSGREELRAFRAFVLQSVGATDAPVRAAQFV